MVCPLRLSDASEGTPWRAPTFMCSSIPPPPWNLRGSALIFLQRASTRTAAHAAFSQVWPSWLPRVLALVHYDDSPVGAYDERAVVALTWRGAAVVEMQVNRELSRRGGRENWGYPKTLAQLSWREYSHDKSASSFCQSDGTSTRATKIASRETRRDSTVDGAAQRASTRDVSRIEFRGESKTYRARVLAPSLPFRLRAFTVQNLNGRAVRVPIALCGKMRLAFCGKRAAIFAEFWMQVEAPRALQS